MRKLLAKSAWLLLLTVVICCAGYTAALWGIGQTFFPFQANGSMVKGPDGKVVGSLLIAQPFTKDEYFQPRPSAAGSGYDAGASASSALAASNYALRARIASALGPIVTYKTGPKAGQLVGPDICAWFQKDTFAGQPGIVAQWADAHNSLAQAWVTGDPTHAPYVNDWAAGHPAVVAQFVKDNPATTQPAASDLAVVFFETFSKENPGKFPAASPAPAAPTQPAATTQSAAATGAAATTQAAATTAPATVIAPSGDCTDIQSTFFDMWRQEHPEVDLAEVPADMVTTSGSGLDPHITLANAEFQLPRVAAKWSANTNRPVAEVQKDIEQILQDHAFAPWNGLAGEKLMNVLEINLILREKFGPPQ